MFILNKHLASNNIHSNKHFTQWYFHTSISMVWLLLRKYCPQTAIDQALGILQISVTFRRMQHALTCIFFLVTAITWYFLPLQRQSEEDWRSIEDFMILMTRMKIHHTGKDSSLPEYNACQCHPMIIIKPRSLFPSSPRWDPTQRKLASLSSAYPGWLSTSKDGGLIWHGSQRTKIGRNVFEVSW